MPPQEPGRREPLIGPDLRTVATVAGAILAVVVVTTIFVSAHRVLGWTAAASIVALLLRPVIAFLDRVLPRALAFVASFLFLAAIAIGLTAMYSVSVLDGAAEIQSTAPELVANIESRDDRLGEIARDIGLADQVTELTDRLDERTGSGGDAVRSAALSAPPFFVSGVLTVFLIVYGPRMIAGGIGQLPDRHRRRLEPAVTEATDRTQLYLGTSLAQAFVAGLVAAGIALVLDLPATGLLALSAGLAALIPYIGITVGFLPVLVLGLGTNSATVMLGVAALVVALQLVEALWWRRWVDHRALHVGPAPVVIIGILGFSVYGIGGAIGGAALTVFGLALADALSADDEPLPTPWDDRTDSEEHSDLLPHEARFRSAD